MALVEMCVGISCSCMPTAAGFFKAKNSGQGWKGWSVSAFSLVRGLLRSTRNTRNTKDSSGSRDYDGSLQHMVPRAEGMNPYVNIEMEGNKGQGYTYGSYQQKPEQQFA